MGFCGMLTACGVVTGQAPAEPAGACPIAHVAANGWLKFA